MRRLAIVGLSYGLILLLPFRVVVCNNLVLSDLIVILAALCIGRLHPHPILGLFLLVCGLSIFMSGAPLSLSSYWGWIQYTLIACVTYGIWRYITFGTFARLIIATACIQCIIACLQYGMQHQLGLKKIGEKSLVSRHQTTAHFEMPKRALCSVDYILSSSQQPTPILRAYGTFPHPNMLGGFLLCTLLLTSFMYQRNPSFLWAGAIILQIMALCITYSRAALFAFLGAFTLWAVLHYLKERKLPSSYKPVMIGLVLCLIMLFPQIFYRGGVISYNALNASSDGLRVHMQQTALSMIRRHPGLGVGWNRYLATPPLPGEHKDLVVHNIFLLVTAETGLVGVALFLTLCILVLYRGWQRRAEAEARLFLAMFIAFLVIGCADYYPIHSAPFPILFFCITSYCLVANRPTGVMERPNLRKELLLTR